MLKNQPCNININEDYNTDLHWSEASKENPCPICEKTDWCYLGFKGSSVEMAFCGRSTASQVDEWVEFGEDSQGKTKYRRSFPEKKARPEDKQEWTYTDIEGNPLAKSVRWDYTDKPKKIRRQYFVDGKWVWNIPKEIDAKSFKAQIAPLYWDEVDKAISQKEYVVICEGETTADAWRKLGFTATTFISGKWADCYKDYFIGAEVVFSPDADTIGIKLMEKIYQAIKDVVNSTQWFYVYPDNLRLWDNLPKNHGVDMKDFYDDEELSPELVKALLETDRRHFDKVFKMPSATKSTIKKAQNTQKTNNSGEKEEEDDKPKRLPTKKLHQFVQENYNLAFNIMTREIEVDGEILDIPPYIKLAIDHNVEVAKEKAVDIFSVVAKENSYNPVLLELERISSITTPVEISDLSKRYFGTSNPLYDLFLEKMLIGAVARAYQPGCKQDTALVLQGEQGIGKSSFFDVLGGSYFDDSMGRGSEKDDLLILHRSWIQEWGELDRIFGKKAVGEVKDFLTKRKDTFREPYARKSETFDRRGVIVGSVNDASFLNDPTGNRRFWVIPVAKEIDINQLKKERDGIWAAAVKAYKEGKTWWLSKEEDRQCGDNNDLFQIKDEWETILEDYLSNKDKTCISELMFEALGFQNKKDMDKGSQARVASCLKSMGWVKGKRETYQGKRQPVWLRPVSYSTPETPSQSNTTTGGSEGSTISQELSDEHKQDKQSNQAAVSKEPESKKVSEKCNPPKPEKPKTASQKKPKETDPLETKVKPTEPHRWVPLEAKPWGTENDLPQDVIENLVIEQLVKNGEMEEYHLIVAVGQKSPSVRQALDKVAVSRSGKYNDVQTNFWKLKS